MRVSGGGGIPQFRHGGIVGVVEEKFDGYGFEKVQYVQIQFLFGGDAGLRIGVELGPSGNLKCNLIFE